MLFYLNEKKLPMVSVILQVPYVRVNLKLRQAKQYIEKVDKLYKIAFAPICLITYLSDLFVRDTENTKKR